MSIPTLPTEPAGAGEPGRSSEIVASAVGRLEPELREFRRDLHRHPEGSWQEHRTTERIIERLVAAGLKPEPASIGTGVICDIGGTGPMIALRGDIDALPLLDGKDVPYRSTVPGVSHACGHDVHTTAVLGAGLALAEAFERAEPSGRVRLIFQPAEETVPGGAEPMIAAGVMDGVSAIFAVHCDPSVDCGLVGLSDGPITSAADMIEIRIEGPGGHTGRPHRSVDLIHLAGKVAVDLPASLARLSDPRDAINLTFGMIEGGEAANIIPTLVRLRGSLRAGGRASWETAGPKLEALLAGIIEPHGGRWEIDHAVGAPPIVNDHWAVETMRTAAGNALGAESVVATTQSGGGEDFSWYLDHAPGCYARLGVRGPGAPTLDIHSACFDVDERCIALGARLLATTVLQAWTELS